MRSKRLGRGLDALIPQEEPPVTTLSIERLRPNTRQPRVMFDDAALNELAGSVRARGIVQPLVVTPGEGDTYTIIAGERRWRAAQRAGLAEVPVVVRAVADERELLELALVENLQRTDLDPMEEAEAYRSLQESFGLSQEEVALRVGKSRAAVANALRLLRLPLDVQWLLRRRQLTAGQARPLLALSNPRHQVDLARRVVAEGLSARAVEALAGAPPEAREGEAAGRRRKPRAPEPHAEAAAERLTRRLQTKVEIRRAGKGGTLRIHFHSEEELIRLYEALMGMGQEGGR